MLNKPNANSVQPPLAIDLDGTLIHSDLLHESALKLLRNQPWQLLAMPFWLLKGRASLKAQIAMRVDLDVALLPFNVELIDWLREQKQQGRRLVLCTASDIKFAQAIALHLNLFDDVMASDGLNNLSGRTKAAQLAQKFGENGFDYAGNSADDLHVWQRARQGVVVNAPEPLLQKAHAATAVHATFPAARRSLSNWRRALRLHQWIKNTLLFVPMFTAHQHITGDLLTRLATAFMAFGLCASSVYVLNDLLDLESDRSHPRKRERPFASGALPIWQGLVAAPLLLAVSVTAAAQVGWSFLLCLIAYFVLTCAYSLLLKRLVLVDCMTLAGLYTMRIIAGAAASEVVLSFWLLALSIFLFLSLAFIKRYAELRVQELQGADKAHGRGYFTADAPLVQQFGVSAGYAATLVLALYLNSDSVLVLYRTPAIIWCAVPLLLLWTSQMWMKAHRGEMHDDPIVFAIKDPGSLVIGALFLATFILAGSR